jgi:hypothetical protein
MSKKEKNFEADKQLLLIKIEALSKELNEFSRQVAPQHWRTCGTLYSNLRKMEYDVKRFTEITETDLQIDWVRDELDLD